MTIQEHRESRAKQQQRQSGATPESNKAEIAESRGERGSPKDVGQAEDRAHLIQQAGPFVFREQKSRPANEKMGADIGAKAKAPTARRILPEIFEAFGKAFNRAIHQPEDDIGVSFLGC